MSTTLNGSLIKALEILDLFSSEETEISAKSVAESLDMSVPTAHRFLLTLEHTGHLVSPRRGQFTLGQKLEGLGRLAFDINPLPSLARPIVESISRDLNESVMACRLGRKGPVCIASTNSRRPIRVSVDIGAELPISLTAQGKLFLADMGQKERLSRMQTDATTRGETLEPEAIKHRQSELEGVLNAGFATNFGENESEIAAIAVPVRNEEGLTVVTLSVFGIMSAFDETLMNRSKSKLQSGAKKLEDLLTNRGRNRLKQ